MKLRNMGKRLKIRHKAEAKFSIKWYQNVSKIVPKCSSRRDLPFCACSRTEDRKKDRGPISGLMRPHPLTDKRLRGSRGQIFKENILRWEIEFLVYFFMLITNMIVILHKNQLLTIKTSKYYLFFWYFLCKWPFLKVLIFF